MVRRISPSSLLPHQPHYQSTQEAPWKDQSKEGCGDEGLLGGKHWLATQHRLLARAMTPMSITELTAVSKHQVMQPLRQSLLRLTGVSGHGPPPVPTLPLCKP